MDEESFLKVIKERRSIRKFKSVQISDEEIYTLIDSARFAPSNGNRQGWRFIVIRNEKLKKEMVKVVKNKLDEINRKLHDTEWVEEFKRYQQHFYSFGEAPVVIVALYKEGLSIIEHFLSKMGGSSPLERNHAELCSVSAAIQNILLTAHVLGLGACWTTGPLVAYNELKNLLQIKTPYEIAAIIPIGRYDELPPPPRRKSINKIMEVIE